MVYILLNLNFGFYLVTVWLFYVYKIQILKCKIENDKQYHNVLNG